MSAEEAKAQSLSVLPKVKSRWVMRSMNTASLTSVIQKADVKCFLQLSIRSPASASPEAQALWAI